MVSPYGKGLTSRDAVARLARDGENSLDVKRASAFKKIEKYFIGPIPLMLLAAAALSFVSGKDGDAVVILALFSINLGIQAWHEHKADSATKRLQEHLSVYVRTLRDGAWRDIVSRELVAGDVIELTVGSVVPADVQLLETRNLTANDSMVTGESLPKEKKDGDRAYAGSFIATGRAVAQVTATGSRTYFGEALRAASAVVKRSALEHDILVIARYLSIASIIGIVLITGVLWAAHAPLLDIATLDLSLLIAGIPVALPTVMSLIISVGVIELTRKQAVVRRLSALEDLANVSMLLSDKTGTLTENALHVTGIVPFGGVSETLALEYAASCATRDGNNPIDVAVSKRAAESGARPFTLIDFIPGDSERKRSTGFLMEKDERHAISFGAPQVIEKLCDMDASDRNRFAQIVGDAASRGERVLALAVGPADEAHMRLAALFTLADRLRADVPEVLAFLGEHGVGVKMLTGDSYEIASDVAKTLGFAGPVMRRAVFDDEHFPQNFAEAGGFAEMLPKDKLVAVQEAKKHYTVAVTGDGVNDVPAVKAADVGVAVRNAVDALRETADIVLLDNGLGVIKDAIVEAREVFMRVYHYSVFRISESFRVIVTIAVIGLLFKTYPLTPVELILLALLNDIPVVSIAFDRVKVPRAPASIDVKRRFVLSSLLGLTGVGNSLLMLWITWSVLHLPWAMIQTVFFLKLVVSGHMLLYVAHTDERWWTYLPSKSVIAAVTTTQLLATAFALGGIFAAAISWKLALFIWLWSFLWMQVSELAKYVMQRIEAAAKQPLSAAAPTN